MTPVYIYTNVQFAYIEPTTIVFFNSLFILLYQYIAHLLIYHNCFDSNDKLNIQYKLVYNPCFNIIQTLR